LGSFFSLSPDGRLLLFQALEIGVGQRYWLHSFETNATRLLTRINTVTSSQFWSPDSRYFAYGDRGELKKVDVSGGPPEVITMLPKNFGGGTWGPDGTIIVGSPSGPLMRVPSSGGTATPVTTLDVSRQEIGHLNPWLLRDGRHFIYSRNSKVAGNSGIWVGSLDATPGSQPTSRLVATGQGGIVAPGSDSTPDYLLFTRDGSLVAQAFDIKTRSLVGEAIQIVERVGIGPATYAQAWVSASGALVYRRPEAPTGGTPAFFDRTGRELRVIPGFDQSPALYPRLSPDGTRLAISIAGDLWVYDLTGRPPVRLTTGGSGYSPLWTRDGKSVVYEPSGSLGLKMLPADGTGLVPAQVTPAGHYHPLAFTGDGRVLLSAMIPLNGTSWKILQGPLAGDATPTPIFESSSSNGFGGASISPDGRWLAYESNATGTREIWVRQYPSGGSPVRVSAQGGLEPTWNRNGRELLYLQQEDLMSVAVDTSSGAFAFTPAVRLFTTRAPSITQPPSYDVAPDGSLLMLKALPIERPPLDIVLDWRGMVGRPAPAAAEH
jgi:serine/threonine-protein kinase